MTVMTAILPLVILILIFGVFIFMVRFAGKFATPKVTHWLLFIYIGVLLLGTAFVPFIIDDSMSQKGMEKVVDTDRELSDLYSNLNKGEIDQVDAKYLMKERNFSNHQNKTIKVKSSNSDGSQILVERKTNNDDTIEAFIFGNGLIIDGYDFSRKLKPYHLELTDDTLTINLLQQQDINLIITKADFPIRQFTGESIINPSFSTDQVVYLRIPNNLELIADDHVFLEFIEK
ncbi:hypothetical protein UP17_12270 [Peribacillus simplex]|uniref:Uncharacterized protein n=1 Tax=Peribacillus simplex TaxID=1478 RepID=A0AAW7IHT2_9BACI|nr:hypothetical protein [Peribacillus simplex]AMM93193.1 hypothetical protein UP17_12270 [Peribacillus simplex]MDM5453630.1 hypothetical protein [Peribacillus simplex]